MKTLCVFVLGAAVGVLSAQDKPMIRIGAEPVGIEKMMGGSIKGAPYTADVITETTQVLADGTRIVNRNTGFVARDSQGRTRNDAQVNLKGSDGQGIKITMIHDPLAQVTYTLDPRQKTAQKISTGSNAEFDAKARAHEGEARAKLQAEQNASRRAPAPFNVVTSEGAKLQAEQNASTRVKTESLGTQVIEGVMADGTRRTETIPAGAIGNDRDIQVVFEVWTAQDLKAVVLSKRTDPRAGEMTYKLVNIQRAEPAASTFEVPADYKVVEPPANNVFYYKPRD